MTGLIFDIQRFSVHDGPGIRTTVFFKGCNLHCLWCHNPESLRPYPEIQEYPWKCIGCGRCGELCPAGAIRVQDGKMVFSRELCRRCGRCAAECFAGARLLVGKPMNLAQVMEVIERDRSFYANSGGGVTFSGGEPLLQPEFLQSLAMECKQKKIHTAVDTAGNVPWENIAALLPYTDLFLFDLKHMNDQQHQQIAGSGNRRILNNLRQLAQGRTDIIIRIPLIEGITASTANMLETAEFLKDLKGVKMVELLPLHHLGEGKYRSLSMEYGAKDLKPIERSHLEELKEFFPGDIPVKIVSA